MLELAGVSAADGDDAPVHVELSDDRRGPFQLWTEGLARAATQAQQADQDVLLGVLVGEEGLPATVGHVVPPYQLHLDTRSGISALRGRRRCLLSIRYLVRTDFVVDFLNPDFSGPDISTLQTHSRHSVRQQSGTKDAFTCTASLYAVNTQMSTGKTNAIFVNGTTRSPV